MFNLGFQTASSKAGTDLRCEINGPNGYKCYHAPGLLLVIESKDYNNLPLLDLSASPLVKIMGTNLTNSELAGDMGKHGTGSLNRVVSVVKEVAMHKLYLW